MKTGETKYIKVLQVKENDHVIGSFVLLERAYGYIVQLHYFRSAGYRIHKVFGTLEEAERFFRKEIEKLEAV